MKLTEEVSELIRSRYNGKYKVLSEVNKIRVIFQINPPTLRLIKVIKTHLRPKRIGLEWNTQYSIPDR